MFHVNGMDLKEEPPLPQQDNESILHGVSNALPSHLGKGGTPSHSVMQPEKKQHRGLRCRKCFELLVHDDEFMFVSLPCFSVVMRVGDCTPTLPFCRSEAGMLFITRMAL